MSGFLARLAERAVGAARLVEPRLRSRFEPDAQFTVASPMEVEEFVDVPAADAPRPSTEHRAPIEHSGSRAAVIERAAIASPGAPRQPVPAMQQVRGSALRGTVREDVTAETVSTHAERGVEPIFSARAKATEPAPARPPADVDVPTHTPQVAARAGADQASAPRQPLTVDPDVRPTPIAANAAKSDAAAHEPPMDQTTFVERLVTETKPEGDDLVFAADTSNNGSQSLDSAPPAGEVGDAMERVTPAAPTHVRSAKTSRHDVRRRATGAIDGDHDFGPIDPTAIDVEPSARRMDRTESMRLEHPADSEPVVHVRIGRIDVRATAPSAPPVPRSTQPRVESLDDYLKRTSGRR